MVREARDVAVDSPDALPAGERQRFFIVTTGRTGSSLLSSILAEAGADFGELLKVESRTVPGTSMEHPRIRRAVRHFRLALVESPRKPVATLSKWRRTLRVSAGKRELRKALREARFLKAVDVDLTVQYAIRFGYFPKIILSYRSFAEHAISYSQMLGSRSPPALWEDFDRVNRNGLLHLYTYGGCAIGYAELMDLERREWAIALSGVTGISVGALLASRARRVRQRQPAPLTVPSMSESADQLLASMERSSGRALPPSEPALRNWKQAMERRAKDAAEQARRPFRLMRVATEGMAYCAAVFDRRVPWYSRAAALALVIAYLLIPWDPIPNRLPYIGHLDDALAAALAMLGFLCLVPGEVLNSLRREAGARLGDPAVALQPLK